MLAHRAILHVILHTPYVGLTLGKHGRHTLVPISVLPKFIHSILQNSHSSCTVTPAVQSLQLYSHFTCQSFQLYSHSSCTVTPAVQSLHLSVIPAVQSLQLYSHSCCTVTPAVHCQSASIICLTSTKFMKIAVV